MKKILIANRGEIAVRVIKSIRKMGIQSLAVYSDADEHALHVKKADEAVRIGPPPSAQSYLNQEAIIDAALSHGADAIHPGYGFLSENSTFAKRVEEAGLIFIGPSSYAIETMGSKLAAKQMAKSLEIPLIPGTEESIADVDQAISIATDIGFPVMIKASAGGGGKGMRIVYKKEEFRTQMERAISEAESSFGDGSVFIEKYIGKPRHIEVQILSDTHGNTVHLFERECSVQRRHQKVVEEAPSSFVDESLRQEMGSCAVRLANAVGYRGAGTVEFLMDENKNFYFLEMNTRLQVEHPVTEFITGLDLVEWQIRIARGEKLEFTQDDLSIKGHAIELRIYAEDPLNGFLPNTGKLEAYRPPSFPGIRLDNGVEEGDDIPVYYDPILSKLVSYGNDRQHAIQRMAEACSRFVISGIVSTIPFGRYVMENEAFRSGDFDTNFINQEFSKEKFFEFLKQDAQVAAELAIYLQNEFHNQIKVPNHPNQDWYLKRS